MKTKFRTFTGAALSQVAFPLGGIGTGTVALGGRGNLQDWEIFNRPNKRSLLDQTALTLRVEPKGRPAVTKVLERQHLPPFAETGHGFQADQLAGLPRCREVTFREEYPFAWIKFTDDDLPVQVALEAFNPFVPMNVGDSSIPVAILSYTIRNPGKVPVSIALLATMTNPLGLQPFDTKTKIESRRNAYREGAGLRGIEFSAPGLAWDDLNFGMAALTTDWAQPAVDRGRRVHAGD